MFKVDQNEKIILKVRKHWFMLLPAIFFLIFAVVLPFLVLGIITLIPADLPLDRIAEHRSLIIFLYMLWVLMSWIIFAFQWTDYYLDVWYITTKRVVDIDQKGVFYREVSSLQYDKIQDITIDVRGLFATLLEYGDIHIETAGENRKILIRNASHPEEVKNIILMQTKRESEGVQRVRIIGQEK